MDLQMSLGGLISEGPVGVTLIASSLHVTTMITPELLLLLRLSSACGHAPASDPILSSGLPHEDAATRCSLSPLARTEKLAAGYDPNSAARARIPFERRTTRGAARISARARAN
jgi:hypothetical protein